MIFVDRNRIAVPSFFNSKEYEEKINELYQFYEHSERSQKRFINFSLPKSVSDSLEKLFNGKCAYCESYIVKEEEIESKAQFLQQKTPNFKKDFKFRNIDYIDHFRPRNNAKGYNQKGTDLEHYWWLSYEWENLYYCCSDCKLAKGNWFPVERKRARIDSNINIIDVSEKSIFINPCVNNIEEHFDFDINIGEIIGKSTRGNVTIELLYLNRENLIKGRLQAIDDENKIITRYLKEPELYREKNKYNIINNFKEIFNGNSVKNHLEFRKRILILFLKNESKKLSFLIKGIPSLKTLIEPDKEEVPSSSLKKGFINQVEEFQIKSNFKKRKVQKKRSKFPILKNIYLTKIELKNYKCFDNLIINFLESTNINREPWLVFLGENGVGKSSVLKAIAVALMGQKNIDKLDIKASKFLQYGKRVGYIKLYGKHGEVFEITFNKGEKIISNIKNPPSYLIGYGSTRLLPKGSLQPEKDVKYVKIKNLFDYSVALYDAKDWLINAEEKMFNQAAKSLKDLLLLSNDDLIVRNQEEKELYIKYAKSNNRIDIDELSDGYKTIFALTIDLIKTLSRDHLAFEIAEGIVLIDEIGTHLHPRWKMEVVNRLRNAFPKLQFIATTHEPLCLRGLGENEVIVLKKDAQGEIIAVSDLPSPNEFRVDQLLTSEYFGLNSTMDFETEDLFKEYYSLIAKESDKLTLEEKKRIDELSQSLPKKKHLGDDIRDELVYYVIDELLAKQVSDKGYKIINDEIKKEAIEKVKTLWKHIASKNNSL